jgi:hypothetical protein
VVFFGLEYAWNIPGEPGCHSSLVIVCSVCPDNAGFSLSPCWSVSWDFPKILLTGRTGGRTPGIQSDQPDPWRKRRQHQHQAPPTPSAHRHSQSRFFFSLLLRPSRLFFAHTPFLFLYKLHPLNHLEGQRKAKEDICWWFSPCVRDASRVSSSCSSAKQVRLAECVYEYTPV